jgi:ribonuclease P protein component
MHFSVTAQEARRIVHSVGSARNNSISIKYMPGSDYRYSVVVSKRQGIAAKRNHMKRILREYMRIRQAAIPGGSYMIFVNKPLGELTRERVTADISVLIQRLVNEKNSTHARDTL